jgi:hypothetical protein
MIKIPIYPNLLGFISILPIEYFMGSFFLISLIILGLIRKFSYWIYFLILVLFLLYTQCLSTIITGEARIHSGLQFFSFTNYIIQYNELNITENYYHTWPGFFLFFSNIFNELSFNSKWVIFRLYPLIFRIVLLIFSWDFYNKLFNELFPLDKNSLTKMVYISNIFLMLFDFMNQDYFSPQSIGLLYFYAILSIVLKISNKKLSNSKIELFFLVIFSITLFITHLLTFIFTFSLSIVWILYNVVLKNKIQKKNHHIVYKKKYIIFIIFFIILFSILMYYFLTSSWFLSSGLKRIQNVFSFDFNSIVEVIESFRGISERIFVLILRLILGLFLIIVTLIYLYKEFFKKYIVQKRDFRNLLRNKQFMFIFFIGLISMLIIIALINTYSDELFQRIYLFTIPMISGIFAIKFMENIHHKQNLKKTKSFGLLVLFLILFLSVNYGNESFTLIYPGEITGVNYLEENYNGYSVASNAKYPLLMGGNNFKIYNFNDLDWNEVDQQYYLNSNFNLSIHFTFNQAHLVYLSKSFYFRSYIFDNVGNDAYLTILDNVQNSNMYQQIYVNNDCMIFIMNRYI